MLNECRDCRAYAVCSIAVRFQGDHCTSFQETLGKEFACCDIGDCAKCPAKSVCAYAHMPKPQLCRRFFDKYPFREKSDRDSSEVVVIDERHKKHVQILLKEISEKNYENTWPKGGLVDGTQSPIVGENTGERVLPAGFNPYSANLPERYSSGGANGYKDYVCQWDMAQGLDETVTYILKCIREKKDYSEMYPGKEE